jgi:hypothetical protein
MRQEGSTADGLGATWSVGKGWRTVRVDIKNYPAAGSLPSPAVAFQELCVADKDSNPCWITTYSFMPSLFYFHSLGLALVLPSALVRRVFGGGHTLHPFPTEQGNNRLI